MKRINLLAILLLIIFAGCSKGIVDPGNDYKDLQEILYTENLLSDSISAHPVNILTAKIDDDVLILRTSYTGGCKEHYFNLYSLLFFMESNPVQISMRLSHNSNSDPCDRLVFDTLYFSLSSLKKLFSEQYRSNSGEIILNIHNHAMETFSPSPIYRF